MTPAWSDEQKVELSLLADLLVKYKDSLVIDDDWTTRFDLTHARIIGRNTDDPGVVLRIRQSPS